MNILFFLTPKSEVAFIFNDYTIDKALQVFQTYRYSAIPMIDRDGKYLGTVTEGDFLWGMVENNEITMDNLHTKKVGELPLRVQHKAVSSTARMEDMMAIAKDQNFVPVVDDNDVFIGIVTRKEILKYCYTEMEKGCLLQQRLSPNGPEHFQNSNIA